MRLILLLTVFVLSACTSRAPLQYAPRPDMATIEESLNCPSDQMPTCIERIGKPYACYCMDDDVLRQILEPDKY